MAKIDTGVMPISMGILALGPGAVRALLASGLVLMGTLWADTP